MRRKLLLKLKWMFQDLAKFMGFKTSFRGIDGEVRVLCFHGICDDDEKFINGRFLRVSQFDKIIHELKGKVHFLNLKQYLNGERESSKLNVLITFDDGYTNNRDLAFPILRKHNVPAVIFCTGQDKLWMDLIDIAIAENVPPNALKLPFEEVKDLSVEEIKHWAIKEPKAVTQKLTENLKTATAELLPFYSNFHELMNNTELKEMQSSDLIDIANHGGYHLSYVNRMDSEILEDLKMGMDRINQIGSPYANVFAYPFGHYSSEIHDLLKNEGVRVQFIADGNPNGNKLFHDRLVVNPFISAHNQLLAIRDGKY